MPDEYAMVSKGKLNLKTDSTIKKKKKHKSKDKEKFEKGVQAELESQKEVFTQREEPQKPSQLKITKAEMAFKKMQEKMQEKRIMDKAAMTHKQRVEKFNEHLDSLTEHFDIPKVSWTK